jgi:TRAP-type C4-dicarboxylate transport system substrate-binding protein
MLEEDSEMKKKAYKLFCLIFCILFIFSVTACSSSDNGGSSPASTSAPSSDAGEDSADNGDKSSSDTDLTEKITLSFSHHDSSTSVIGTYWQDWADRIREASDGMIDITVYAAAALAAPADGINALNSGICDILWTSTGFFPDQFPVTDSVTMPFNGVENAIQGAYVLDEAFKTISEFEKEWSDKGLKVLFLNTAPASYLLTNTKISVPSDSEGKTLRSMSGLPAQLLSTMGASAVVSPSGEIFTSMEKGVLHGTIFDLAGARGFNLYEVTDYLLDLPLYCTVVPVTMLQSTWDSLPAKAQEIIAEHSGLEGALDFAVKYQAYADEYYEEFRQANRLVTPTTEGLAEWDKLAESVTNSWIDENTTSSLDYRGIVDSLATIIEEYAGVTEPIK